MKANERIIFALDVRDFKEFERWVEMLSPRIEWFKVGKELFTAFGPDTVKYIKSKGKKVFLDLKYFDIPTTVRSAVEVAGSLGVDMLTVHALGGTRMLMAAVEGGEKYGTKVIAVTILTSLVNDDIKEIGLMYPTEEMVVHLAQMAKKAGIAGVVASAHETGIIRDMFGKDFTIVTPGIRIMETADDQKRTMTPKRAVEAGASYLVIGRPIKDAKDPLAAIDDILASLEG